MGDYHYFERIQKIILACVLGETFCLNECMVKGPTRAAINNKESTARTAPGTIESITALFRAQQSYVPGTAVFALGAIPVSCACFFFFFFSSGTVLTTPYVIPFLASGDHGAIRSILFRRLHDPAWDGEQTKNPRVTAATTCT